MKHGRTEDMASIMLTKNGWEKQKLKVIEELAELIQAIAKESFASDKDQSRQRIFEEMCDVIYCIGYISEYYKITRQDIDDRIQAIDDKMWDMFLSGGEDEL